MGHLRSSTAQAAEAPEGAWQEGELPGEHTELLQAPQVPNVLGQPLEISGAQGELLRAQRAEMEEGSLA